MPTRGRKPTSAGLGEVLDLKTLIELKRTSTDPKDKQRLPVFKETLRQLEEEYGRREDKTNSEKK